MTFPIMLQCTATTYCRPKASSIFIISVICIQHFGAFYVLSEKKNMTLIISLSLWELD